ncbi:MAG: SulP family inorganic anion transporter [Pseudomonadota bacterium]
MLHRFLPFLTWLPMLRSRETVRADLMAGLTGAIVVLPQGVAFATIAGMPPEYGLYAAMVPAIVAALFGSSHHLVSGPTTAASVVLFSSLSALATPGSEDFVRYALTLTFVVGLIQLAMGVARLGVLVNFISHSVIVGFTAGAAILIASNQLGNFLGLETERGQPFYELLVSSFMRVSEISWPTLMVGMATLVSAFVARRLWPKVPFMIVGMVVGAVLAELLRRYAGAEIAVVGAVPGTLPPLSGPDLSLETLRQLAPAVLAVTLFALAEAVSIARSLAARSGQIIDGNQEFIGQGLSNLAGAFFSSYVATGSFNRSGVNFQAGARTPLAALSAGLMLMVIVLFVAPLFSYLPNAAMAAILFMVAWGIVDVHHITTIVKVSRSESIVLFATFSATLLLELEFAVLLGVFLSLVVYLSQASQPQVLVRSPDPRLPKHRLNTDPDLPQCPQVKLVRIDGALFFGAVNYVTERLLEIATRSPQQKHLLLLVRAVGFVDVAGAEAIAREARNRKNMGGQLYLHSLKDGPRAAMERGGFLEDVGDENIFDSKSDAIRAIFEKLDKGICARCDKRIFLECESVPQKKALLDG